MMSSITSKGTDHGGARTKKDDSSSSTTVKGSTSIPLIELPPTTTTTTTAISTTNLERDDDGDAATTQEIARRVVQALQTSGFLLVRSDSLLPIDLQRSALQATKEYLTTKSKHPQHEDANASASASASAIITHPIDPKIYIMLESLEDISTKCGGGGGGGGNDHETTTTTILSKYWKALEAVKRQVLTYIALGLELEANYFVKLHAQNRSSLRLLHYPTPPKNKATTSSSSPPPPAEQSIYKDHPHQRNIRCKPHSDYGSITLLLTDGVPGLQALIHEEWTPVPHVEGALVVNVGSLFQDWTNGKLLATLHRVVEDTSGSVSDIGSGDIVVAAPPRTSLAFFADPDPEVSATLTNAAGMSPSATMYKSVAEYIQWRSGGEGRQRSGLAFSKDEEERAKTS